MSKDTPGLTGKIVHVKIILLDCRGLQIATVGYSTLDYVSSFANRTLDHVRGQQSRRVMKGRRFSVPQNAKLNGKPVSAGKRQNHRVKFIKLLTENNDEVRMLRNFCNSAAGALAT